MPLVGQGGTHRWEAFVVDGSEAPADPSVLTLTVRDSLGAVVTPPFPVNLPTIIRDAPGVYHDDWVVDVAQALGDYTATWTGILNGAPMAPGTDTVTVVLAGSVSPSPAGGYTYDLTTDVGRLRLLIQDHDLSRVSSSLALEKRSAAFTDEELAYFISVTDGLFLAAAVALRTWATNKQLIVQRRQNGKADVDFGTIRRDLLDMAKTYEEKANDLPADAIAEMAWTDFTLRQILDNASLREAVS